MLELAFLSVALGVVGALLVFRGILPVGFCSPDRSEKSERERASHYQYIGCVRTVWK